MTKVRTIKKISHDLMPLAQANAETALLVQQALKNLEPYLQFNRQEALDCFNYCIAACEEMAVSADLVKKYVEEVDQEAEKASINKGN